MGSWVSQVAKGIQELFSKSRDSSVLIIGLDNSGKTTILYQMKMGENVNSVPTIGFNVEEFTVGKVSFTSWDIGGESKQRSLWVHYIKSMDAIAYIIDASDRDRLDDAWEEFYINVFCRTDTDDLNDLTVMFFLNKQDLDNSISGSEFIDKYNIKNMLLSHPGIKNWYVVETVATTGEGLYASWEILASALVSGGKKAKPSGNYGRTNGRTNQLNIIYEYLGWNVNRHILFPKQYRKKVWILLLISLKGGTKKIMDNNNNNIYTTEDFDYDYIIPPECNKYSKNIFLPPEIIMKIMSFVPENQMILIL